MVELIIEETDQGALVGIRARASLTAAITLKYVAETPLNFVDVVEDVHVTYLFKLYFRQESIQVYLAEVDLRDSRGAHSFLHCLLRVD